MKFRRSFEELANVLEESLTQRNAITYTKNPSLSTHFVYDIHLIKHNQHFEIRLFQHKKNLCEIIFPGEVSLEAIIDTNKGFFTIQDCTGLDGRPDPVLEESIELISSLIRKLALIPLEEKTLDREIRLEVEKRVALALFLVEDKQNRTLRGAANIAHTSTATIRKYQNSPVVKNIISEWKNNRVGAVDFRKILSNRPSIKEI